MTTEMGGCLFPERIHNCTPTTPASDKYKTLGCVCKETATALDIISEATAHLPTSEQGALMKSIERYLKMRPQIQGDGNQQPTRELIPNFYVVFAKAKLLAQNEEDIGPHIEATVDDVLFVLWLLGDEKLKLGFCEVLQKLSVRIQNYLTDCKARSEHPAISKYTISRRMYEAFYELFYAWLQSSDLNLTRAVLQTVGAIYCHLHKWDLEDNFPRVIQGLQELYNTGLEPIHVTKCLSQILHAAKNAGMEAQNFWCRDLCLVLFSQVCLKVDMSKPVCAENSHDAMHCFNLLAQLSRPPVVEFLRRKLNGRDNRECLIAVRILQELSSPKTSLVTPLTLMIRLLTVSCFAPEQEDQKADALDLLKAVGPLIHPSVGPLWNEKIPELHSQLEEIEVSLQQREWENLLFKFITCTMKAIRDDSWNFKLIQEIDRQFRYSGDLSEQVFLHRFQDTIFKASTDEDRLRENFSRLLQDPAPDAEAEKDTGAVCVS